MTLIKSLTFSSILLTWALIATPVESKEGKGVEIRSFKINSPNNYVAYRLDINNFRNVPLEKSYTLFELLPKDGLLAPRYNVTSVMERISIGIWKLNDKFNVKILPWDGLFYRLVPISDQPDLDIDSEFDNSGLITETTKATPNSWQVTFKNEKSKKIVQRFKIKDLVPHDAPTDTIYRVKNSNDGGLIAILLYHQYLYVEVDPHVMSTKYDLISATDVQDTYFSYNVTAHLADSVANPKWGRLSIIFNGAGKRFHTYLSPSNEDLIPGTDLNPHSKVWHTTLVPMNIDQIESIKFTWFGGKKYDQAAAVSFDKVVIEPLYLLDKKVRKDKTIAFLGSSFFLSGMYFELSHKVDPFDDSIRP